MLFPRGITFDDVLLVPGYNGIRSRQAVTTDVTLGRTELRIPIMSANMDTITGSAMAEAMANALEHGFADRNSGQIDVRVQKDSDWVELSIADDGATALCGGLERVNATDAEAYRRDCVIVHSQIID